MMSFCNLFMEQPSYYHLLMKMWAKMPKFQLPSFISFRDMKGVPK